MNQQQEFIYLRTYSRWNEELKRRERWPETIARYMRFIEKKVDIPAKERKKIESAIINLQVMPSMRALWAAGPAAEKTNASVFNCAYNNITSIKSFSATMYLLMCGCGVGFSVENHFIARLPELKKKNANKTHVVVEDSREGWARAFYKLLIAHFEGHDVTYDLSKLRPAGARLKTFGGKSSGPGPLKDLFDFVGKVFNEARRVNRKRLSSLDCLDILNKAGECVTAGGIRRSAQISLSDLDDSLIAGAKQGQFWLNNGHRALSNNSAVYHGRPDIMRFLHEFTELIKSGAGERGIFNRTGVLANMPDRRIRMDDMGTNPCQPPNTLVYTRDGDITIKELASKCRNGGSVEVWDGNKWVACNNFRETGYHQDVYTVTLYDGTVIEATGYHKFLLEDGTRLKLLDLKLGDRLARSYAPGTRVPNDNRIKSLAFSRNEPIVYCCTIPSTNSFALSCGIQIGQCSEITLRDKEFCNLSSNVIRANDSLEDVLQKVRVATHIGTIQAMFTDFPEDIMGKGWMKNCNEERLLGVSLTGLRDHPVLSSVNDEAEQWLKSMKYTAISEAEKWSKAYGINMPASITCIKPEGCISLDTEIKTTDGTKTAKELFELNGYTEITGNTTWLEPTKQITVLDKNNQEKLVTKLFINGISEVFEIEFEDGFKVKLTGSHKLLTSQGWVAVKDLTGDEEIISF